ncbi:MAG: sigma-70 family RNA polymerase sigma factor [Clostridia bacterium]|nr:sigma-70 family RNA polymerase sigma factor [Clostridia bacterium]
MGLSNNIIDDNILVSRAKSGNAEALTLLLEKYSEKIMQKSLTFKNLNGLESEDLYQEGMIGFVSAVYSFDERLGVRFSTYANTIAVRKMLTAIRKTNNKSNIPLQFYVSLEDETDLLSYSPTPEESVIYNEELDLINNFIENNLSKSEKKVFRLNVAGLSYSEIADVLECDEKFVDNALQRIRRKLRKLDV